MNEPQPTATKQKRRNEKTERRKVKEMYDDAEKLVQDDDERQFYADFGHAMGFDNGD